MFKALRRGENLRSVPEGSNEKTSETGRAGHSHVPLVLFFVTVVFLVALVPFGPVLRAQDLGPRLGFGPVFFVGPFDDSLMEETAGVGGLVRVSKPLNQDVSLAGGVGLAAYVLHGSEAADYALNPQLSLIVTLRGTTRFPYVLVGVGGYLPLRSEIAGDRFFTAHGGVGWAWPLQRVSLYLECDPAIGIREEKSTLLVPIRAGIIF
jgi:hypothetical protein